MRNKGRVSRDPFQALADATRRGILELLKSREDCSAGEIAGNFSRISRPAVSRHLRVLREAGLVIARESGREQRYTVCADEIARMQREWFSQFTPIWGAALQALKRNVERNARRSKGVQRIARARSVSREDLARQGIRRRG